MSLSSFASALVLPPIIINRGLYLCAPLSPNMLHPLPESTAMCE